MQLRAGDPKAIGGYTLQARLGAGGMGTVFLARTPSGRPVAVKLIHQQFLNDEEFRTRFRQEVAAARRVSGAFTAAVVDADPDGDHPWMATTYISGPTLAQRISDGGALSGAELRTLAIGLVEALRDIHRAGVVHRDLKPSNVVLSPDGPRVIDFGISRAADHQTLTMTGRVIGTPPFMSPEQLQAPREVGTESDVFSVATLLVYAATGQGPFDADSPYMTAYQVVHEAPSLGQVPEPLRVVVERCLSKDRSRRPSADGLLQQLRALPDDLSAPPGAPAPTSSVRAGSAADADAGGHSGPWQDPDDREGDADSDTRLLSGKAKARGPRALLTRAGLARFAFGTSGAAARPGAVRDGAGAPDGHDAPGSHNGHNGARNDRPTLSTRSVSAVRRASDPAPASSLAAPAAAPGTPAGKPPGDGFSRDRAVDRPAFPARGLRWRWRTAVAVAAAVAAVSTGVTLLSSAGSEQQRSRGGSESAGAGGAHHGSTTFVQTPPKGFGPWQTSVPGGQQIPDELRCVPHGDSVYCGGGGVLAARLRAADGTRVWNRTSPGVPVQGVHLVGVAGGAVVGYRIPAGGFVPWQLVGVSTADGKELWSAPLAHRSAGFTGSPQDAVLLGTTVFSADVARTGIVARRAGTGAVRWTTPFPAGSECIPVVAGTHLYAMCAPRAEADTADVAHPSLRTLDPATGALGGPARVDGHLRPVGAADDGSLVALEERRSGGAFNGFTRIVRCDPRTGRITTSSVGGYSDTTPGMAGGTLYFAGDDGLIRAVDPVTGKQKWSVQTSVESASGPVLSHGVLYFSSASGRVAALDELTGRPRWTTNPRLAGDGPEVGASPRVAVAGGALIVVAGGNTVFAFDTSKPPKASS